MDNVEWKRIFKNYEINNYGDIRSLNYKTPKLLHKHYSKDGYIQYNLSIDGKQLRTGAHRLVAIAFIPNPSNKETVNHIDGNKHNNYYKNLEWVSRSEQMVHAYKLGLKQRMQGELNYNHSLTDDQIREIREIYKAHSKEYGMIALAKKYGVSEATINRIVHNRSYKNVK